MNLFPMFACVKYRRTLQLDKFVDSYRTRRYLALRTTYYGQRPRAGLSDRINLPPGSTELVWYLTRSVPKRRSVRINGPSTRRE